MSSGPRKHGVVSPEVVAAVEAFFALDDWEGLWLTGGTCLAEYWFGHRTSVDIDLFTADADRFRAARSALRDPHVLGAAGTVETLRADVRHCAFLLRCPSGLTAKVDLVHDLPVVLDRKVGFGAVWLDSLLDIASNKLGCLLGREEAKDYVDLFFLLPHLGLSAAQAVELGLKKEAGIDPLVLGEQLRFIEARPRPDFLRTEVPWENVLDYFRTFREDVLRLVEPGAP